MLRFSDFIRLSFNEIVEPIKTTAKRRNIIKNAGTMRATPVIEYQFRTSLGNLVKLHFRLKDESPLTYDVSFYVNDTQYDDASRTDGNNRDPEILGKVLYLIRSKADLLKAEEIHFLAQKGEGDVKVVRNLNIEEYKPNALQQLNLLKQWLQRYEVKMIEPNKEVYLKLRRPIPPARPDIDVERWVRVIDECMALVIKGQTLDMNNLEGSMYTQSIATNYPQHKALIEALRNYTNAILSNTDSGFHKRKNRRASLYSKLLNRYFSDWDIEQSNDSFVMKRQQSN
jgi:hypothetical protein